MLSGENLTGTPQVVGASLIYRLAPCTWGCSRKIDKSLRDKGLAVSSFFTTFVLSEEDASVCSLGGQNSSQ